MKPERTKPCDAKGCKGIARMDGYCAAYICDECENHVGLARCYCGWAKSGGDGYRELEELGENIEEDYE